MKKRAKRPTVARVVNDAEPRRIVFEETGEVRCAKMGEWYECSGEPRLWVLSERTFGATPILRIVQNDFTKSRLQKRAAKRKL